MRFPILPLSSLPLIPACLIWMTLNALGQQAGDTYSDSYAYPKSVGQTDPQPAEYQASRPYREAVGSQRYVPNYEAEGDYRQPTSIELMDSHTALIGTKRSGQIFQLSLPDHSLRVVHEDPQASWGDMAKISENLVAVAEHHANQVVLFRRGPHTWDAVQRLDAPGLPKALAWDENHQALLASGQWSHRLYRWSARRDSSSDNASISWKTREHVDLPMPGGRVLLLSKHDSLLIVDAFGRDYAVVGLSNFQLQHHSQLYGHNVTGLSATPDEEIVFFPHQLLNEYARSVRTDITWGGLMSNNIRWLRTERLLHQSGEEVFKQGRFYPLGTPGNGAGDPSSMAVSSQGRVSITLGGTNRVAIGRENDYYFRQVDVGIRPIACTYSPDESELLVVNQFSDSLSIVDLKDFSVQHILLGPVRSPTLTERGEQAFFNSRLSHDGWMSCHSCHSEGHTSGQLNDNFTDQTFGTPKRILSLLGQAETMPYAWNGAIPTLEEQIGHSLASTMASNDEVDDDTVAAIASFVRQLPAPPSVTEARQTSREESQLVAMAAKGHRLFKQLNCADCHAGQRYTTPETYDVGLRDESDMALYNPPSLIAVSQRQNALLHDGRAKSIRDLIVQEKHQLPRSLDEQEQQALVQFLESL